MASDSALLWDRTWFTVCACVFLAAGAGGLLALSGGTRRHRLIAALAILAVFLCGMAYYFPYTNDDAYIFFRYAENVVAGLGPVYNPGELCEGFTSPAWLAILSIARWTGADLLMASKVLGAVLALFMLLFIWSACRRVHPDEMSLYIVTFLMASCTLLLSWVGSGMDVALFLFWESLVVWLFIDERTPEYLLWLITAAGGWIRPEANLVIVIAWAWRLWVTRCDHAASAIVARVAGLAGLLALPFISRYIEYGTLLPTTFFAKSDRTIRSGIGFLFGAAHGLGPMIWILALAGLWKLRHQHGWLLLVTVAYAVFFVAEGGDVLTQRFSLYWIPFLSVGLVHGLTMAGRFLGRRYLVIGSALLVLVSGQELHRMYQVTRAGQGTEGYLYVSSSSIGTTETDAVLGQFLRQHALPGQRLLTDNIGAIGHYSKMYVTDFNGLTDTAIAGLISHGERDQVLQRIKDAKPEWIAGYPGPPGAPDDYGLNTGPLGPWVRESYSLIMSLRSRTGYTRVLLKRNDVVVETGQS